MSVNEGRCLLLRAVALVGVFVFSATFVFAPTVYAADDVTRRLPNGLTVIQEHRPGAPVTAVQLWVRVGSADEVERTLGLAHFLEHMLFKGTTSRPVGSIHAEIEKNGGEINAATSDDWTYYHVAIASSEWRRALDIITDIAVNASFPQEEIDREREVIEEEIARRDDNPMALLYDNLGAAAYAVHPYRMRVIGSETSLACIDRNELVRFYRAHYAPEKMAIVLVGDFDPAAADQVIDSALGRVSLRPAAARRRPVEPARTRPRSLGVDAAVTRTYGAVAFGGPKASDLRANAAGDVLATMLTGDGIGRLSRRLVDESKIADMLSASLQTSRDPGLFTVIYSASPENRVLVEGEITRAIRALGWDRPASLDVDDAIRQMQRDRVDRRQSAAETAFDRGYWFAMGVMDGARRYDEALDAITPADVTDFARRNLATAPPVIVALLPEARVASQASDGGAPEASAVHEGGTGTEAPGTEVPVVIRGSSDGAAAFGVFLDGGQSDEPAPGWSSALAGVMNRGVAGRPYADFTRDLARVGVKIGAASAMDFISVIASGDSASVGALVNAVFDVVEKPNMADLEVVREGLRDALDARADQPLEYALDHLNALRFDTHPYGRPEAGTPAGLNELTAEKLEAWRRTAVQRARMRFVFVGDVAETVVRAAVARRIAGFPEGAAFASRDDVIESAPAAAVAEEAATSQAMVMRSLAAPGIGDFAYPAWKLANAILGGRSSSRLFRIVREERGLAYAVGSFFPTRRQASHLVLYAGTRPENAPAVRALWNTALAAPTALELEDAKRLVRGEFALDHEKVDRRAWYLGWYETLGVGADYDADYPRRLNAVMLDDVAAIFTRLRTASPIDFVYGGAL